MAKNDSVLKDIKKGKGLKPLPPQKGTGTSSNVTTGQDGDKSGIGYLKHSLEETKGEKR